MRKIFSTAVLSACLSLSIFAAAAAAYTSTETGHNSFAVIVDGKSIYDTARFGGISFYVEEDGVESSETNLATAGSITIYDGDYSYYDLSGNLSGEVTGETRQFGLVPERGNIGFVPALANGTRIIFRGSADGGLRGKNFTWALTEKAPHSGVIPNMRTTKEQLDTFAPYIELNEAHTRFNWKIVKPGSDEAISPPIAGSYRIRLYDKKGGEHIAQNTDGWLRFGENSTRHPSGYVDVPQGYSVDDVQYARVDIDLDGESDDSSVLSTYHWRFDVANRTDTDNGLDKENTDFSADEPITILVGEVKTLNISFKPGYYTYNDTKPALIADETVLQQTSWRELGPEEYELKLRGASNGETSFSVLYWDEYGQLYRTEPTTVIVGSGVAVGGGGGGGGCNAGFGAVLLLAAGRTLLRKR